MEFWILGFDERVMVLTVEDEGIGWTSDLGLLGSLGFVLLDFWHDNLVSRRIPRRSNLHQSKSRIINDRHWGLDEISRLKSALSKILDEAPRSYRKRVAIIAIPS